MKNGIHDDRLVRGKTKKECLPDLYQSQ